MDIPKPEIKELKITVRGTSGLIMHKWSEKAKKEMLAKQQKKASKGRAERNPKKDYENSIYYLPDGRYGFPAVAFKSAAVRAAKQCDIPMTDARVFFHVQGAKGSPDMVEITGTPQMREDIVRLNGKTADLRYRAEFPKWKSIFNVKYNAGVISEEQIINLFQIAGFSVGVGEWRPEKNGQFGTFEIATEP